MIEKMRIGILGGTFDPIHIGHLILAEEARGILCLDKVIFVPAYIPPHKKQRQITPADDRYAMVSRAVKSNPFFEVSDLELKRQGVSYSVETVREIKTLFPKAQIYFIAGSDSLREFSSWKEADLLAGMSKLVIAQRPGYSLQKTFPNTRVIEINAFDISSTQLRRRIKNGKSVYYLIPEEARKYILEKQLYCGPD